MKLEFCRHISNKSSIPALMKIRPVVAETDGRTNRPRQTDGRTEGRTDMTKLIVAFSSFAKTPKKYQVRKAEPPCVVRHLGGRLVSQSAPLSAQSPTAIHPIGTALTP
jgi:hypothetical protein